MECLHNPCTATCTRPRGDIRVNAEGLNFDGKFFVSHQKMLESLTGPVIRKNYRDWLQSVLDSAPKVTDK